MKIKIIYSYNGANFNGSQTQPHKNAVEDFLNLALSRVGIFKNVISSSRTDKGVHALNQVSSVECGDFWDCDKLKHFLNFHCKPYIFIKKIEKVDENFQVRFDAKARSYRYILNHDHFNPFLSDFCYFYPKIDIKKLNEILEIFLGTNDFKNFMKMGSNSKTSVRNIMRSYAFRYKNLTIIKFKANGFLRSQVRLMVANSLKSYETNEKFSLEKPLTRILAPANGLFLERVFY